MWACITFQYGAGGEYHRGCYWNAGVPSCDVEHHTDVLLHQVCISAQSISIISSWVQVNPITRKFNSTQGGSFHIHVDLIQFHPQLRPFQFNPVVSSNSIQLSSPQFSAALSRLVRFNAVQVDPNQFSSFQHSATPVNVVELKSTPATYIKLNAELFSGVKTNSSQINPLRSK